ncbi:MAG: DUF1566 domain-containing protein [Chromatiales bacterium]|nr:DUF1566 domain-containing protein [Chromatiales bacterium]
MSRVVSIHLLMAAGLIAAALPCMAAADCTVGLTRPDDRYANQLDGTITDMITGLTWKQCSEGQIWDDVSGCTATAGAFIWQDALQRAEDVNAGDAGENLGHDDWRLPNVKELRSLVEAACHGPAINQTLFPATPAGHYWSASPDHLEPDDARHVSFDDGSDAATSKNDQLHVRLVRGGLPPAPIIIP